MLAIIGGSGVYNIDSLTNTRWVKVDSPFGAPSDEILTGALNGQPMAFLPRHGRGHRIPPSEINFRANIDALKRLGATAIISVSAVGSLREHLPPGMFVIVDQFIDRTFTRAKSFFSLGRGRSRVHGASGLPAPGRRRRDCRRRKPESRYVRGGTYLVMEGPQFSSLAESELYRSWNCDVIGMTNMPEAKLAREAEICYATVAMVTDYDCWHPQHDDVTVDMIIKTLLANADNARSLVKIAAPLVAAHAGFCPHGCQTALEHALITTPEARDPVAVKRLDAVAGRVLNR